MSREREFTESDAMRARAKQRRDQEKDPAKREAYALVERMGMDWYDTESVARRVAERAGFEIHQLKALLREALGVAEDLSKAKALSVGVKKS